MKSTKRTELFNIKSGCDFLPLSETKKHPNAEYFTGEIVPTVDEQRDGITRVILAFRKIITVNNGEVLDCTKSGEKAKFVAVIRDGKIFVIEGEDCQIDDDVIGIGIRKLTRYTN